MRVVKSILLLLPRDAMHKRGLCCHAVSVCLCDCVCVSVTFVDCVKTNKPIFDFSPSGSHTILVFPYQTGCRYSDGNPLTGASNANRVGRNRDSEPMPAVDSATGEVLSTWSLMEHDHHLAMCDTYIAGRIRPHSITLASCKPDRKPGRKQVESQLRTCSKRVFSYIPFV